MDNAAAQARIEELERAATRARELLSDLYGRLGGDGVIRLGLVAEWDATFSDLTYAVYPHLKRPSNAP